MTVALLLGALLAVAVVFAAVRRGLHGEPTTMALLGTTGKDHLQSAASGKK